MLPKGLMGRLLVVVIAAVVGFLMVSQLGTQQRFSSRLESESEGDLARILSSLNGQTDSLREEIASLRLQLLTLQTSSERSQAAVKASQDQLDALQVLAGTVAAHGPGVILKIDDPQTSLTYDVMVDVVQELRDAGAEAIAVNGNRVGAASFFSDQGRSIALDGKVLKAPYEVAAIGQPDTLSTGLAIPGGAIDTLKASKGVAVSVDRQADVVTPALAKPPAFSAAHPVASGG